MGAGAIPLQVEKDFFEKAKSRYKMHVYTAETSYEGDDRIDISAQGGYFIFMPPKQLLFDYRLGSVTAERFKKTYFECLEESYIRHRHTWDTVLKKKRMVLVCSCDMQGKTCHRYHLVDFLKKLGAVYKGELKCT